MFYREVLDGLRKRGFKLSLDHKDAQFLVQGCVRTGGYYLGKCSFDLSLLVSLLTTACRRWRKSANYRWKHQAEE